MNEVNVSAANLYAIELTSEGQYVLAAGPQTKQPDTMEYRIVLLRHRDESYSVHSQIFDGPHSSSLVGGRYFQAGKEGFTKACKAFGETVANQAVCYATIFQPPVESMEKTNEVPYYQR